MAISKIILNGVTQMDVTDTTATALDVASGEYFYSAAGVKAEGTATIFGGSYIIAIYTQTNPVVVYDSLNFLKSDLVVAYFTSFDTYTIVDSSDYTLSGTLAVGDSTITVTYGALTATFVVTVSLPTTFTPTYFGNTNLARGSSTVSAKYHSDKTNGDSVCTATSGDHSAFQKASGSSSPSYTMYPFKVPSNAKRIFAYTPNNHSNRINIYYWSPNISGGWMCVSPDTWKAPYSYLDMSGYRGYNNDLYVSFSLGSNTTDSADKPLFVFGWV